ncbi:MAG: hypothetical protein AAFV33_14965 [Chloroflexota bacterium]
MTTGLYYAHSGTRWLVVLSIIVALGFMIYSLATKREQDRVTRIVMGVFSALIGIQWVLGLLYYLLYGNLINNYSRADWVAHLTTMTVAMIVAPLYVSFRKRASTRVFYIASIVILLVVSGLIVYGVSFLGGGARWSFAPQNPPPQL